MIPERIIFVSRGITVLCVYHTADIPHYFLTTLQTQHTTDIPYHWHTKPVTHHISGISCYITPLFCCSWRFNWSSAPSFFFCVWNKMKCQIQISCETLWIIMRNSLGILSEMCHNFFFLHPFTSLCEKCTLACIVGRLFRVRNCHSLVLGEFCRHTYLCQLWNLL